MCLEIDGCQANKPQPGSSTPCFPGVACTDVASYAGMPNAAAFQCAPCPVGFAGDGISCTRCPLEVVITGKSFAGSVVPVSSAVSVFSSSAPRPSVQGVACPAASGGVSFLWRGDSGGFLVPLDGSNGAFGATLRLPPRSLVPGQLSRFVVQARSMLRCCNTGASPLRRSVYAAATRGGLLTLTRLRPSSWPCRAPAGMLFGKSRSVSGEDGVINPICGGLQTKTELFSAARPYPCLTPALLCTPPFPPSAAWRPRRSSL